MKKKEIIIEIIIFLHVLLFLYAAGSKLTVYDLFITQMDKSPLLTGFTHILAWLVPSVEIIIAVMLLVPRFRLIGLYGAFGLMVLFTFYIISILTISKELPCSCGGVLSMLGWREHLVFNIGFVLLGLTGIILMHKKREQQREFVTA